MARYGHDTEGGGFLTLACVAAALVVAGACCTLAAPDSEASERVTTTVRYQGTNADFPNPERGFHTNVELVGAEDLSFVRDRGYTLARSYVRLDDYRERPLTSAFLGDFEKGLRAARSAGIKVIPRFSYNFPEDVDGGDAPDASLPRVLEHIGQLRPLFREYKDVIAVHQASFIGAWGEWHSSGSGLDTLKNKRKILAALLEAVPPSRSVQLRYPADMMSFYPSPLTPSGAFSRTDQARIGHHNDCFLANEHDAGTYLPIGSKDEKQRYLAQTGRYVPVGGETCQVSPQAARTDCPTAVSELRRFHWSYINRDFYVPAIRQWKREGCYEDIARRLGYRLRLASATVPRQADRGDVLPVNLALRNDGFAAPYNRRNVEVVLRDRKTGNEVRLRAKGDPRRWLPGASREVAVRVRVPPNLTPGDYAVLLNLPDPAPRLRDRPEYSVRLANEGLWEPQTGYNRLKVTVRVR